MPGSIVNVSALSDVTQLDGVYIEDIAPVPGIQPINGRVVAVVGEFEWGPVDQVTTIGSGAELNRIFGGIGPDAAGAFYKGALSMRGKIAFGPMRVVRVSNATQAIAEVDLPDDSAADVVKVQGRYPGERGNEYSVDTTAATDGDANHFDLVVKRGGVIIKTLRNLDLAAINNGDEFPQSVGDNDVKVTRIALGDGVPAISADKDLVGGSNGTFADADYTGSSSDNRGLYRLRGAAAEDVRWVWVAESSTAAVNAELLALSAATDKNVIIAAPLGQDKATTKTDVASYRSDRVVYVGTGAKVYVAEAQSGMGGLVTVQGDAFMASVVSSIDPGRNPAGPGINQLHQRLLSGVRALEDESLTRTDYEDFRRLGICGLEASPLGGFLFRSGVTTSLASGRKNISRRTIADFIQLSGGAFLLQFQGLPIWSLTQEMIESALNAFVRQQQTIGLLPRREDPPENTTKFSIQFTSTAQDIANGLLIVELRVRTFANADFILFRTRLGESVDVGLEEVAA